MPLILPENQLDAWLSGEPGKKILVPYPAGEMTVWPISPRGNSPKNNDAGILEPIAVDAQAHQPDYAS
jgi:putative SOS response-associated peptidase YedK